MRIPSVILSILPLVALMTLTTAMTCETPPPGPPTPPDATGGSGGGSGTGGEVGTGGDSPAPADDCEAAERKLRALQCKLDGTPLWETPGGTPFATACRAREADGDSVCPRCLSEIDNCSEAPLCRAKTPGVCP